MNGELNAWSRARAYRLENNEGLDVAQLKNIQLPSLFMDVCYLIMIIIFAVGGGYLNRMREGWHPTDTTNNSSTPLEWPVLFNNDNNWTHDAFAHWVLWGLPIGFIAALAAQGRRSLLIFIFCTLSSGFGIYVSIESYVSLGYPDESIRSANTSETIVLGVFDWLIGQDDSDWSDFRRGFRDMIGLTLQGLVQTTPTGLIMYLYGYHWSFFGSGLFLGLIYNLAYSLSVETTGVLVQYPGVHVAQFLWGFFLFFTLILSIFTVERYRPNPPSVSFMVTDPVSTPVHAVRVRGRSWCHALFPFWANPSATYLAFRLHIALAIFEIILLTSSLWSNSLTLIILINPPK